MLGPLIVRRADGTSLTVGGSARRLVFGALLSRSGRTVPADVLIEDVWGAAPPRTAAKTLQSHIVRLRDDLGRDEAGAVLITERQGYRLVLGPDDFDVAQFEAAVRDGLSAAAAGRQQTAVASLDEALGLWRGEAYEEFADAAFSVAERLRLFELHAQAEELRTGIALDFGATGELVPVLEKRVAAAPYRERGWEQLILALYRAGRQSDALGAYRRATRTLAEDLGVEPGPALRDLEARVLRQDPGLLAEAATVSSVVADGRREVCPYRGLATYTDADSDLFVGRERLTAELVGLLSDHRAVVVVGASGTGKSSMLRAGVVAALRDGALPGSAAWRIDVLTPGRCVESGVGELDMLVIDQSEELFTLLSTAERHAVTDQLEQYTAGGGRLVVALRGDYYGRLAELPSLAAYAGAASVLVGPMRDDELRRVVVEPAERVGLAVDDDLLEAVLDDVAGQPAALPMLSTALVRTWENRAERRLTLAGYRSGGGVALAVEATAEDAYLALDETGRTAVRRLLLRLAGREGDAWVRRPIRRSDVPTDDQAAAALGSLTAARLVTVAQERVEITHDALLVQWPRLRGWLEERVLGAELLDHLTVTTRAWADAGRPDSDLYRGARLRGALDWRNDHPDDVSVIEAEFLELSEAAAEAELRAARAQTQREARGRRRLRGVVAGLAAMVVLASVGVGVALHERSSADRAAHRAREAALTADARRLAALSANAPDIATSSLLAVAAYRLQDSSDTRGALLAAVERNQSALWRVSTPHGIQAIVTNPAGTRVAVSDDRRMIYVYDTRTRRPVAGFPSRGFVVTGMSGDGRQLVVSGADRAERVNHNRVAVFDIASGRRIRVLTEFGNSGLLPAMSQDARWLAVLSQRTVGGRAAVSVFDARNWAAAPRRLDVPGDALGLAVSRDALAVQAADGSVTVWSLPALHALGRVTGPQPGAGPEPLAVAPDGSTVAVVDGHDSTRVAVYPTRGGISTPMPAQPQGVGVTAYSPDGRELGVSSNGGSLNVYRPGTGALVDAFTGGSMPALGLAWSGAAEPTGLYSGGLDGQLVSWTVRSGSRLMTETGPDLHAPDRGELFGDVALGVTPADAPASGKRGYALDIRTGHITTWPLGLPQNGYLNQLVASRDGRTALASTEDPAGHNTVVVRNLVHNRELGTLHPPSDAPRTFALGSNAALSPDGRTAYVNLDASRIGVFDVHSGRYLRSFTIRFSGPDSARVEAIPWQFDPNGRLIFGGFDTGPHPNNVPAGGIGPDDTNPPDQRLGIVDVRAGRLVAQTDLGDVIAPSAIAWSPDRQWIAVGTYDGTLSLYDARTLRQIAAAGHVEPGPVRTVSFAPRTADLVTAGAGGVLAFRSVPDLTSEGDPIFVGNGATSDGLLAWYLPSGRVVGLGPDLHKPGTDLQRRFTFRIAPADLVRTACALGGGDLTRAQWRRYVADQAYRQLC